MRNRLLDLIAIGTVVAVLLTLVLGGAFNTRAPVLKRGPDASSRVGCLPGLVEGDVVCDGIAYHAQPGGRGYMGRTTRMPDVPAR